MTFVRENDVTLRGLNPPKPIFKFEEGNFPRKTKKNFE